MLSMPASRYVFYPVTWYSVCIVTGAFLAIWLAAREEKRAGLKKDTIIDLALWLLPIGILGARLYYVIFSWDQFRGNLLSVFRIWEGGLAIYGGIIAGLITVLVFCRKRKLPPLLLCDLIAPGLALAQAIGRWGNYFNTEAYGLPMENPALCFFPLAVQIPEASGNVWHMATFFYESMWNLGIFVFLMILRRKKPLRRGDVFFLYAFCYAAGRLWIEDLRMDSLYATSSVRVSQLLSILMCAGIFLRYWTLSAKTGQYTPFRRGAVAALVLGGTGLALWYALAGSLPFTDTVGRRVLFLILYSLGMILCLKLIFPRASEVETHADNAP